MAGSGAGSVYGTLELITPFQSADGACGAGLAPQLHHKLSLCELSKDVLKHWWVSDGISK